MIKVAIVDDHQIVRAGFRSCWATGGHPYRVRGGEWRGGLAEIAGRACDVLLLDLSLPGQSGIDVLRSARQRYPELGVLVLSGFPEERYALAMIRNGADGYLCRDCEREELLKAVRAIAQGVATFPAAPPN